MEERQKKEEELLRLRQSQFDEEQRQLALVQQGMREARSKVLGAKAPQEGEAAAGAQALALAQAEAQPAAAAEAASHSPSESSSSGTSTSASSAPYLVVEDAVPDMGAVAWPAALPAPEQSGVGTSSIKQHEQAPTAAAVASAVEEPSLPGPSPGPPTAEGEDAESVAQLTRLQGFVSGTMSGSKSALETYKAQRQ